MNYNIEAIMKKYPSYFGVFDLRLGICEPPEMAVTWGDIIKAVEVYDIPVVEKMQDAIDSFRFIPKNAALICYMRLVGEAHDYDWADDEIIDINTIADNLPGFGWEDLDKWEAAKRIIDALVSIVDKVYSR